MYRGAFLQANLQLHLIERTDNSGPTVQHESKEHCEIHVRRDRQCDVPWDGMHGHINIQDFGMA